MKKIISILAALTIILPVSLNSIACSNKKVDVTFLSINDEDKGEYNKNIENITFNFMYSLPKNLQPKLDRDYFNGWNWKQSSDLKTMYGRVIGNFFIPPSKNGHEYWEVRIKKTNNKGLFINWYQEHDYNPWNT